MKLSFYTECETDFMENYEDIARNVANSVFTRFPCPYDLQISLYIVTEEIIQEANRNCRGIDRVTDVLSFPNLPFDPAHIADFESISEEDADYFDPENGELILGEIMVCANRVYSQADEYGHSPIREFAFLTAHSLLHLLGFDHMEEADRLQMEALQEELLKEAGYERR